MNESNYPSALCMFLNSKCDTSDAFKRSDRCFNHITEFELTKISTIAICYEQNMHEILVLQYIYSDATIVILCNNFGM